MKLVYFTVVLWLLLQHFILAFPITKPIASPNYSWKQLDELLQQGISIGVFPGAVAAVGNEEGLLYAKAFGKFTYNDSKLSQPMTLESIFDMASCTKILIATTAIAQFYERGEVDLQSRVADFFPDFQQNGKEAITLTHLLLHNSGFPADPYPGYEAAAFGCPETSKENPQQVFTCSDKIFDGVMAQTLKNPVGQVYIYSDLSMITLSLVLGKLAKDKNYVQDADILKDCPVYPNKGYPICYYEAYVRKYIFGKMALNKSYFRPSENLFSRIPPTWIDNSYRHMNPMHGVVSDANAYAMGGVSGHAGLFSTIADVSKIAYNYAFADMVPSQFRLLNQTTIDFFIRVRNTTQSSRALGWDTNAHADTNCSPLSPTSFTHTGYTGTSVCVDPERKIFLVLLTNRVYPDPSNTKIIQFRPQFSNMVKQIIEKGRSQQTRV